MKYITTRGTSIGMGRVPLGGYTYMDRCIVLDWQMFTKDLGKGLRSRNQFSSGYMLLRSLSFGR